MGFLSDVVWKDEYKYYDTPEGQDCAKKIGYVAKYAGLYGFFGASLDILMISHPKGYGNIVGRYVSLTIPIMGIGATFAAATCAATNFRKKDDPLNYALGSLAATSVWAAWRKSFKIGVYGGLFCAAAAAVFKDCIDNNYNILTNSGHRMRINPWTLEQDWTLTKDPGRTWKKSSEV